MSEGFIIEPVDFGSVKLKVVGDDNVTVVTAKLRGRIAVGTARRAPGDRRDENFGAKLAAQRALAILAADLNSEVEQTLTEQAVALNEAQRRRVRKADVAAAQRNVEATNRLNPAARARRKAEAALQASQTEPLADWEKELLREDRTY